MLQTLIRVSCRERLDVQIPISAQPEHKIQEVIDVCLEKFPERMPDEVRRRVRVFLKNSRKKVRRKVQDDDDDLEAKPVRVRRRLDKVAIIRYQSYSFLFHRREGERQQGLPPPTSHPARGLSCP